MTHHTSVKPLKASQVDFSKFPPKRKPADLTVPVDWKQDPHKDRSWRARLHKWDWIWPLLADFHQTKDEASFLKAYLVASDWLSQNPLGKKGLSEFSWNDTSVGFRAEAISYLLRAGVEKGLLDSTGAERLLNSAIQHGERLANDKYYTERHNHGLYQDLSLAILCQQLNELEQCKHWRSHAVRRFKDNLYHTVDRVSGMHLEHSPGYHFAVIPLVSKMVEVNGDAELERLAKKMRDVAGWLAPPDDRQIIIGDTAGAKLPKWVVSGGRELNGIAPVADAGYGIVKSGDSYLLAFLAHHSPVHKHRDDGTFVWYEQGLPIITDTGKYAYRYSDPERKYAVANRAHNTLVVDSHDEELGKPYGSGIETILESAGWYAVIGTNPSLQRYQVHHRRLWLYRPKEWLFVIDSVISDNEHRYERYFHFWHELEVQLGANAMLSGKLADTSTALTGRDLSPDLNVEAELIRDQKEPLQGVMYPYGTKPRPNYVLKLSAVAQSTLLAIGFNLGSAGSLLRARVSMEDGDVSVRLPSTRLELKLRGAASRLLIK